MARIVVLSDIHLSPTHGFFWENWCVAREFADAAKADAVIVNGDLAINGPDSDAEIAFAAAALGILCRRSLDRGCRSVAPGRCQRAAFRLGTGA
jgi:hypothetical protein